ncbi:MAG: rRNA maturation RNase YbeY [Victivallales bacterium]|jgi:probable rRNA maturation factor
MDRMIEKACAICGLLDDSPGFSLAVNFVDTETICRINREFVGHEGTTDVISFNYAVQGDPCPDDVNAELFICTDTAELAAKSLKKSFSGEIALYLVHGILHISGENDLTPSDRKRMRRLERKMLSELGKSFDFSVIFPGALNQI